MVTRNCVLALVATLPAASAFVATDKAGLKAALTACHWYPWDSLPTYGPVAAWDVKAVTDFDALLMGLTNFEGSWMVWLDGTRAASPR